jgi:hypothetical protein
MDIKTILHALAILSGIVAAVCAMVPSQNKIALFICFSLIAGVFEITIQFTKPELSTSKAAIIVFPTKYSYVLYWIQERSIQPILEPSNRSDQPNSNELFLNIKNIGSVPCSNLKIKWSINADKIIKEFQQNEILNMYNLKIATSPNFISLSKKTEISENTWSAPFSNKSVSKVEYLASTPSSKEKDKIAIPTDIEWIYLLGAISRINDFNKMQTIECPEIKMNIEANCVDGKDIKLSYLVKSTYSYIPPAVSWDKIKMESDNIPIYTKDRPKNMVRGTLKVVEVKEDKNP